MVFPGFIGGSYQGQNRAAGIERTVNWYVHFSSSRGAKGPALLHPTPGVKMFASEFGGKYPCRGVFADHQKLWTVVGDTLYEVDSAGTPTAVKVIGGNPALASHRWAPARMAANSNNNEFAVASNRKLFHVALPSNTVTEPLDGQSIMVDDVVMVDGFFLVLDRDTSTVYQSDRLAGTSWDVANHVQRATAADPWRSMIATPHGQIWLFGSLTSEVFWNAGTNNLSFSRVPNSEMNSGTAAAYSPTVVGNAVYWLHQNRDGAALVMRSDSSFSPQVISPPEVSHQIGALPNIEDAIGFGYQQAGHTFYVLTFPSGGISWVYDLTTEIWHERMTFSKGREAAWGACYAVRAFGRDLVGALDEGSLHELSFNEFLDVGDLNIRRIRQTSTLAAMRKRIKFHRVEIDYERAVADETRKFVAFLQWSNDNGKTWTAERQRKHPGRMRWERCGSAYDRVFRFVCVDPVPWKLVGATLDYTVCAH